jgi:hypothetical protein
VKIGRLMEGQSKHKGKIQNLENFALGVQNGKWNLSVYVFTKSNPLLDEVAEICKA